LRGIVKTYRLGDTTVEALRGIDLTVNRGEFAAVWGPSGSGKSTLLNIIGLIDTPTSGDIILAGQPIGTLNDRERTRLRHQNIGFIFQGFNLVPVLSAYENVEYPLLLVGTPAAERRDRTLAMLDAVGLSAQHGQRPNELSGGQKQRVAIARALVKQPDIVLADEPTANLDSRTGAAIIELMRRVQVELRTTFIFSTHDPQLISHAEEIFTIRDGELASHSAGAPQ
jgi:putative ABC transport system ATP-binding protein